jgi:hypothetical protein
MYADFHSHLPSSLPVPRILFHHFTAPAFFQYLSIPLPRPQMMIPALSDLERSTCLASQADQAADQVQDL